MAATVCAASLYERSCRDNAPPCLCATNMIAYRSAAIPRAATCTRYVTAKSQAPTADPIDLVRRVELLKVGGEAWRDKRADAAHGHGDEAPRGGAAVGRSSGVERDADLCLLLAWRLDASGPISGPNLRICCLWERSCVRTRNVSLPTPQGAG
eukprot:scaffold77959_cov64-Phaeocystis_antarctica.AAC.14